MKTQTELLSEIYKDAKDHEVHPTDVKNKYNTPIRYARELIGMLHHEGFLNETEDGTFEAATNQTDEEFTEFLHRNRAPEEKPVTTTATKTRTRPAQGDPGKVRSCTCGCGENVAGKSMYKPGHDARHAGNVAREIASNYATKGFDRRTVLAALPSDKLKAKAETIAERLIAKIETKEKK